MRMWHERFSTIVVLCSLGRNPAENGIHRDRGNVAICGDKRNANRVCRALADDDELIRYIPQTSCRLECDTQRGWWERQLHDNPDRQVGPFFNLIGGVGENAKGSSLNSEFRRCAMGDGKLASELGGIHDLTDAALQTSGSREGAHGGNTDADDDPDDDNHRDHLNQRECARSFHYQLRMSSDVLKTPSGPRDQTITVLGIVFGKVGVRTLFLI